MKKIKSRSISDIISSISDNSFLKEEKEFDTDSKDNTQKTRENNIYNSAYRQAYNDAYSQVKDVIKNQMKIYDNVKNKIGVDQLQNVDPNTGMPVSDEDSQQNSETVDPNTGMPVSEEDPQQNSENVDPNTGMPVSEEDPETEKIKNEIDEEEYEIDDQGNIRTQNKEKVSSSDEKYHLNDKNKTQKINPLTGQPYQDDEIPINQFTGQQDFKDDDISNLFQLKKINEKLLDLSNIVNNETNSKLNFIDQYINESIELLNIVVKNYSKYKQKIQPIIMNFYEFIGKTVNILKEFYSKKQKTKNKTKNTTKNNNDNDNEEIVFNLKI